MALQVKGTLVDKASELLGGANVTERRLETLMDELRNRREADMKDEKDNLKGMVVVPPVDAEPAADEDAAEADDTPDVGTGNEALLKIIRGLEAKVEELNRTRAAGDKDQEIGAGRLPLPNAEAPPLGLSGLGDIPVGKWVVSPLGPKVSFIICGCGTCTVNRVHHWYCVVCRSGRHHFQQRYPHFQKNWMAPGAVWGISHQVCSEPCRMQYLGMIGVVAGLNDHEPPQVHIEGQAPGRPAPAHDSD